MTSFRETAVRQLNELARDNDRLRTRLNGIQGRPQEMDELLEIHGYQARADAVYTELGMRCPGPLSDESPDAYRRRILGDLAQFSRDKSLRDTKFSRVPADALNFFEQQVFADAQAVAANPKQGDFRNPHKLRRIEHEVGGVRVIDYRGDPGSWMSQFTARTRLVRDIDIGRRFNGFVDLPGER